MGSRLPWGKSSPTGMAGGIGVLCACTETPPRKRRGVLSQAAKQRACWSTQHQPSIPGTVTRRKLRHAAWRSSGEDGDAPGGTHTNLLLHPLPVPPPSPWQQVAGDRLPSVPPHRPGQPARPFMAPPKPAGACQEAWRGAGAGRGFVGVMLPMNYSGRDDNYRSPLVLLALCRQEQGLCHGEGWGQGEGAQAP